eukprot:jgi/Mesvir1/21772/Mv04172-RA.1
MKSPELSSSLSFDSTGATAPKDEVRKDSGSIFLKLATSLAALPSPTVEQVLPLVRECPSLHPREQGSGQAATSSSGGTVTTTEIDALLAVAHFLLHSSGKHAEVLLPILLHNIKLLPFAVTTTSITKDDWDDPYSPRVVFGSLFEYLAGVAGMQLPSGSPRAAISHTITETARDILESWVENPNLRRSGVSRSGTWGFLQALGDVHLHLCPRDKSLISAALHAQWLDLPGQSKLVGESPHGAPPPGGRAKESARAVNFQSGTKGSHADGSHRDSHSNAHGHEAGAVPADSDASHSAVLGQLLGAKLAFRAMAAMIRGRWRRKAEMGVAGASAGAASVGSISQGEAMERNIAAHLRGTRRDRLDGFRSYCPERSRAGSPTWVLVEHSRILDGFQLDDEDGAYAGLSDDDDTAAVDGPSQGGADGAAHNGGTLGGASGTSRMVVKGKTIKVPGSWLSDDGLEDMHLAAAYEFVSSVIDVVRSARGSSPTAKPKPDASLPFHEKIMTSPSLSAAMFSATREAAVLLSQILARRARATSPSSSSSATRHGAHAGPSVAPPPGAHGSYTPKHAAAVASASTARDAVFHFMALVDACVAEGYTLQYSCSRMAAVLVQEAASIAILQARANASTAHASSDDASGTHRIAQGEELTEVVLLRMKVQLMLHVPELYALGGVGAGAEAEDLGLSAAEYRERKEQLQRTLIGACCRVCRAEWERGAYAPVRTFLVLLGESLQQLDMGSASSADISGRGSGAAATPADDDSLPGLLLSFFVSLVRSVDDPVLADNVLAQLAYDRISDDVYVTSDSTFAVKVLEAVCDIASMGHAGPYSTVVALLSKLFKDPVEQRAYRGSYVPGVSSTGGLGSTAARSSQGPDLAAQATMGRSVSISQLQPEDVVREGLARLTSPFYSKEVPRLFQRFASQLTSPSLRADLRVRLLDLFSYMGSLILDQGSSSHEAYLATLLPAIAAACRDLPPGNPPGWNILDADVASGPALVAGGINPAKRASLTLNHETFSKARPAASLADASSLDAQAGAEHQVITPALRRLFRNLWFYIAFLGYAPPVALRRTNAGASAKGQVGSGGDNGGGLFRWDKNAAWVPAVAEIAEVTPPLNPSESHKRVEVESELSALLQLYKSSRSRRHKGKKLGKPRVACMRPKVNSPEQRAPGPRFSLDTSVATGAQAAAAGTGGATPSTAGYGVAAEGPRKALELLLGKTIDAAALASLSDGMATFLLSVAHLELLRLGHESSLRGKCSLAPVLSYLNNPDANPEEQRVMAAIAECVFAAVLASLDRGDSVAQLGWGLQHQDAPGGGALSVDAATRWSLCDAVLQRHTYTLLSGVAMRGTVLRRLSNNFLRRLMQHHPQILHSPACVSKLLRVVGEVGFLHENEARGGGSNGAGSLAPPARGLLRGAVGSISATVVGGSSAGAPPSTMGGDLGEISKEVQQLLHLWLTRAVAAAPLTTQCLVQEYARQNNDIDISLLASLLPPTLVLPPKQGREAVLAADTGGGYSVITAVAVGGHSTQRAKGAGATGQNPVSAFVSAITAKSLAVGEVQGMREYGRAMAKLASGTKSASVPARGLWALPPPGMGVGFLGGLPFAGAITANAAGIPIYLVGGGDPDLVRSLQQHEPFVEGPLRASIRYIGPDEPALASRLAATLIARGIKHLECVALNVDDSRWPSRCRMAQKAALESGMSADVLPVLANLAAAVQQAVVEHHGGLQIAILVEDVATYQRVKASIPSNASITLVVYETSVEVLVDIRAGQRVLAVDLSEYTQGYLALALASVEHHNGQMVTSDIETAVTIYGQGAQSVTDEVMQREVCRAAGNPVCGDPGVLPVTASGCTCFDRADVRYKVIGAVPKRLLTSYHLYQGMVDAERDLPGSTFRWTIYDNVEVLAQLAAYAEVANGTFYRGAISMDAYLVETSARILAAMHSVVAAGKPLYLGYMQPPEVSIDAFLDKYKARSFVGPKLKYCAQYLGELARQLEGRHLLVHNNVGYLSVTWEFVESLVANFLGEGYAPLPNIWKFPPTLHGSAANRTGAWGLLANPLTNRTAQVMQGLDVFLGEAFMQPLTARLLEERGGPTPIDTLMVFALSHFVADTILPMLAQLAEEQPELPQVRLITQKCTDLEYLALLRWNLTAHEEFVLGCLDEQMYLSTYLSAMAAALEQQTGERIVGEVRTERLLRYDQLPIKYPWRVACEIENYEKGYSKGQLGVFNPLCDVRQGCVDIGMSAPKNVTACSGHGTCQFPKEAPAGTADGSQGTCLCQRGWTGPFCSDPVDTWLGGEDQRRRILLATLIPCVLLPGLVGLLGSAYLAKRRRGGPRPGDVWLSDALLRNGQLVAGNASLSVVVMDVDGLADLLAWDARETRRALEVFQAVVRLLLSQFKALPAAATEGAFTLAFLDPVNAVGFAMALQSSLLYPQLLAKPPMVPLTRLKHQRLRSLREGPCDWPLPVLKHADAEAGKLGRFTGKMLFRGLRVRVGIHVRVMDAAQVPITIKQLGQGDYVDVARAIRDIASGGQVLLSMQAWRSLGMHMTNTVCHHMGIHEVKEGLPPIHLMQVLPKELAKRAPFPPLKSTKQLGPSFFDAPAAECYVRGEPPKDPVVIAFMYVAYAKILRKTPGYQGGVDLLVAFVQSRLAEFEAYEVEEKEGNFLLAFRSAAKAVQFAETIQREAMDLPWSPKLLEEEQAAEVIKHGMPDIEGGLAKDQAVFRGLRLQIGMCMDVPSDCQPHMATGRAAYFGPVVNRAARIAATAAPGQTLVNQPCYEAAKDQCGPLVFRELGQYHLKGVRQPMHLYQVSSAELSMRLFPRTLKLAKVTEPIVAFEATLPREESQEISVADDLRLSPKDSEIAAEPVTTPTKDDTSEKAVESQAPMPLGGSQHSGTGGLREHAIGRVLMGLGVTSPRDKRRPSLLAKLGDPVQHTRTRSHTKEVDLPDQHDLVDDDLSYDELLRLAMKQQKKIKALKKLLREGGADH